MKKWYLVGLLVLAVALVASFAVACEKEEATETTAAVETTVAPTEDTEATVTTAGGVDVATIGVYFLDQGDNKVQIVEVPVPGMQFNMMTEGDYPCTIEVFDAAGASLGNLELPETAAGVLDYSSVADTAAKIVVTTSAGQAWEYMVP
jgi:hypothetical protein